MQYFTHPPPRLRRAPAQRTEVRCGHARAHRRCREEKQQRASALQPYFSKRSQERLHKSASEAQRLLGLEVAEPAAFQEHIIAIHHLTGSDKSVTAVTRTESIFLMSGFSTNVTY
jgi:hypothetical protein